MNEETVTISALEYGRLVNAETTLDYLLDCMSIECELIDPGSAEADLLDQLFDCVGK